MDNQQNNTALVNDDGKKLGGRPDASSASLPDDAKKAAVELNTSAAGNTTAIS